MRDASIEFEYVAGDASLDLVNTVAWGRAGLYHERLTSYRAFSRWAEGAGLISGSAGAKLRRLADEKPRAATQSLNRVLVARNILRGVFTGPIGDQNADQLFVAYNGLLRKAMQQIEVRRSTRRSNPRPGFWSWRGLEEQLDSPLWPAVYCAANLLVSDAASRIRMCGGMDCGWIFVDDSRNGLRRWCDMAVCGTRAKSLRRREKTSS